MTTTDRLPEDRKSTEWLAEHLQWPAGTIDLVCDHLRIAGWHFFFSGLPNDVYSYGFRCQNTADANRALTLFGRLKAANLVVRLSPDEGRPIPLERDGPGFLVVFQIGCQKILDEWFGRLPVESVPAGRRVFGVHRLDKVPTAMPPTLTICLGDDVVVLKDLRVPPNVTLVSDVDERVRKARPNDPVIAQIDRYVEQWRKQRPTTSPAASQTAASAPAHDAPAGSRPAGDK